MMILSPAKTLDLSPMEDSPTTTTIPDCNAEKTKEIMQAMKKRTQGELGKLLGYISKLDTDCSRGELKHLVTSIRFVENTISLIRHFS